MIKRVLKTMNALVVYMAMTCAVSVASLSVSARAEEKSVDLSASKYEYRDEFSEYELYSNPQTNVDGYGTLTLTGDIVEEEPIKEDIKTFNAVGDIDQDKVYLKYSFPKSLITENKYKQHIEPDYAITSMAGVKLDSEVEFGKLVVQTSYDGEKWITDQEYSNIFDASASPSIQYELKNHHLTNGCYYRVLVAYRTGRVTGKKKVLLVTVDDEEIIKYLNLYQFYVCNENESKKAAEPDMSRVYFFKEKAVNTGKNNGYAGNEPIGPKDVHYGWDIGHFFVSGHTGNPKFDAEGNPIFMKNVGDKVALWFDLSQNIDKLHGNANLSINSNKKGTDQYFGIPEQALRQGAMIIRFTDYQNRTTTQTYTNYLAAASTASADTKVQLFEEGDYEVALDYEIRDSSNLVGPVPKPAAISAYRVFFKFSVRNSNCMVFQIDLETGRELKGNTFTESGFRLDQARSRYLDVSIKRGILNVNDLDLRVNQMATDLEEFTDEGVYEFSVQNRYTGESTTKLIYVGKDNLLKAYVKEAPKYTIADLRELEKEGYIFQADGSIVEPEPETETESVEEGQEAGNEEQEETIDLANSDDSKENSDKQADSASEQGNNAAGPDDRQKKNDSKAPVGVGILLIAAAAGAGVYKSTKNKKGKEKE